LPADNVFRSIFFSTQFSITFYVPSPKSRYHVSQLANNLPEFFCIVFTGLQNSFSPIVYDDADCEFVAPHTSI